MIRINRFVPVCLLSILHLTTLAGAGLSKDAKSVVKYLKKDWKKKFRSTSIAQTMENLGLPDDDELRIEVGEYFRAKPGLIMNLRFWGANNYLLSDEEKRIAKYLINSFEADGTLPTVAVTAEAVGISDEAIRARLSFLSRAGFLTPTQDSPLGYSLTEEYATWAGPLRYNFHTIQVEEGKPFAVW